ncbi:MAG: immunoglobulin domain-containing protein, partial [Verrucomicrobiae bacterium]|nr:immunoglobulin domain-containing protein [Verrucomicrobiae bacterium]
FTDDFSSGAAAWRANDGWILVEKADGQVVFRGDQTGDAFAKLLSSTMGASWRIEVDVTFRRYDGDNSSRALAGFALFPALDSGVQLEANLEHWTPSGVQHGTQWFNVDTWSWRNVLFAGRTASSSPSYRMKLTRPAGSDRLIFQVTDTNGFSYRGETAPIPVEVLDRQKVPGLRVNSGQVEFDNFRLIQPFTLPPPPVLVSQPTNVTVFNGLPVTLRVVATDPRPLTYQWRRGVARLQNATNATYTIAKATATVAGSYTVEVSNGENVSTTQPALVTVLNGYLRPAASHRTNDPARTGFTLDLLAPTGAEFVLERSADLTQWTEALRAVGTGLPVEFTDLAATNRPHLTYRLLFP